MKALFYLMILLGMVNVHAMEISITVDQEAGDQHTQLPQLAHRRAQQFTFGSGASARPTLLPLSQAPTQHPQTDLSALVISQTPPHSPSNPSSSKETKNVVPGAIATPMNRQPIQAGVLAPRHHRHHSRVPSVGVKLDLPTLKHRRQESVTVETEQKEEKAMVSAAAIPAVQVVVQDVSEIKALTPCFERLLKEITTAWQDVFFTVSAEEQEKLNQAEDKTLAAQEIKLAKAREFYSSKFANAILQQDNDFRHACMNVHENLATIKTVLDSLSVLTREEDDETTKINNMQDLSTMQNYFRSCVYKHTIKMAFIRVACTKNVLDMLLTHPTSKQLFSSDDIINKIENLVGSPESSLAAEDLIHILKARHNTADDEKLPASIQEKLRDIRKRIQEQSQGKSIAKKLRKEGHVRAKSRHIRQLSSVFNAPDEKTAATMQNITQINDDSCCCVCDGCCVPWKTLCTWLRAKCCR